MLRLIYLITAFAVSVITSVVYGQTEIEKISITGTVVSEKNELLVTSIVYLMDSSNKSIVKTEFTDQSGRFLFENVSKGTYLIKISENGKQKYLGEPFQAAENIDLKNILIKSEVNNLQEVVVAKAKPYIERQDGKTILNVENSIAATGSSAFEILEKAPGIRIDQNDNVSLRGKNGIIVQIDGKPTPMSGSNLANYLRGIPSGSIEKIEFITNPSSKYDAAGTSIINIKMKKDKRKGTNGSLAVSYGQGKYPKNNNSVSLSHRDRKINVFGNYSFAYREGFNKLLLDRSFYENGNFAGAYDQNNYLKMTFRNHLARAGMDYLLNDKHTLGIIVSGVNNRFNPTGNNFSDVYDESHTKVSRFETRNHSHENWRNGSANLNYKYVIDTTGTEFTTDFDYANYGNKTNQNFDTDYFNLDGSQAPPQYRLHGDIKGGLDIYAVKSDFVTNLKSKIKLETGVKSSFVKADNNLSYYNRSTGIDVFDTSKSNHFIYKENINAAYINASKEFGKWNTQFGLRLENTNIKGQQLVGSSFIFNDSYVQLFPSALVSYAVNPKNSIEFNYSRRIQRPGYDQLNPFKFFLDETTYKEGNPYLKPQTTHSFEFTHVLNQKIYTTLSFSRTNNNITETISPSETEDRVTVQTTRNLDNVDIYSLSLILPLNVAKWWDTTNNFNFYVGSYSGTVANTTLSNSGNFTWNFNSVNNFKLGNGFFAELSANYQAKENYAFDNIEPIWFVNTGIQKKFKNKSSLKLAVNDIFNTNEIQATTKFTSYVEHFKVKRDSQVIILSYTYNFGHGNGTTRRRTGGAEASKQRAGSSTG
jgi:hypothetical protein